MIPRAGLGSRTRGRVLGSEAVQVLSEPVGIDRCCTGKGTEDCCSIDKPSTSQRSQLADANPVAGDDEAFPRVKCAHDLAALVPQLSLRDLSCHSPNVARVRHLTNHLGRDRDRPLGRRWLVIVCRESPPHLDECVLHLLEPDSPYQSP
jgi:hypothetical protein